MQDLDSQTNDVNPYDSIPGIIINTMPKSASVYIFSTLSKSLKKDTYNEFIAPGYFPDYYLMPSKVCHVLDNRLIRQEHFDAKKINIHVLEQLQCKMILHFRDPRQAMLSWVHHCEKPYANPAANNYSLHLPCDGYIDLPFEKKIDWHIETHFKSLVNWAHGWANYLQNPKIEILLTSYESMRKDEEAFFARILDFYNIPQSLFIYTPVEKDNKHHYRKGELTEWEHVFSEKQKMRCDELMDEGLMRRFGWKKATNCKLILPEKIERHTETFF